jgi:hypothetical protein
MKRTAAMMAVAVLVGSAMAQNTNVIDNTRNTLNQVQQKQSNASNAALAAAQGQSAQAQSSPTQPKSSPTPPKPSPAVPAKSAAQNTAPAKPASATAATPVLAKSAAPTAAKSAASPAMKPATPAVAKSATPAAPVTAKPAVAAVPAKAMAASPSPATKDAAKKPGAKAEKFTPVNVIVPKIPKEKPTSTTKAVAAAEPKAETKEQAKAGDKPEEKEKDKPKEYSSLGKRDPFLSPVVAHNGGSGCSTGKKCLDIAQINLRGVVKSEAGMIAVVTNSLNKAYFLRENDPVFNGYVIKITGDSIVFKESFQDQLGKPMTRDVTKKITTPAV